MRIWRWTTNPEHDAYPAWVLAAVEFDVRTAERPYEGRVRTPDGVARIRRGDWLTERRGEYSVQEGRRKIGWL